MGVEVVAFNIFVEHRRLANAMLAEQFGNEGLFGGFHQTFSPVTAIVEFTGKQKNKRSPFNQSATPIFTATESESGLPYVFNNPSSHFRR